MSVVKTDAKKLWTTFPNSKGMVLAHGERLTMYYIEYDPNMTFPEHSHPQEQVGYCIEGEGEIGIGKDVFKITPVVLIWNAFLKTHFVKDSSIITKLTLMIRFDRIL